MKQLHRLLNRMEMGKPILVRTRPFSAKELEAIRGQLLAMPEPERLHLSDQLEALWLLLDQEERVLAQKMIDVRQNIARTRATISGNLAYRKTNLIVKGRP